MRGLHISEIYKCVSQSYKIFVAATSANLISVVSSSKLSSYSSDLGVEENSWHAVLAYQIL